MRILSFNTSNGLLGTLNSLREATDGSALSTERLSSGLRINSAKDDAAGLAVASTLEVNSRIYGQGVRNLNDGISLINIVDGALQSLTNIATRLKELALQASSSTLIGTQRKALQLESNALTSEFNRIIESTSYNRISPLATSNTQIRFQGGFGIDGSISSTISSEISRTVGDGTFKDFINLSPFGHETLRIASGDFNSDGKTDLLSSDSSADFSIAFGVGDGTFSSVKSFTANMSDLVLVVSDFNNDSNLDIFTGKDVLLGDGAGNFSQKSFLGENLSYSNNAVQIDDINSDGNKDILVGDYNSGSVKVFLGKGDGVFLENSSVSVGTGLYGIAVGDVTADGVPDLFATCNEGVLYFKGLGGGAFGAGTIVDEVSTGIALSDQNGDGNLDLIESWYNKFIIKPGNGNGSFNEPIISTYPVFSYTGYLTKKDLNGDGVDDFISNGTGEFQVLIGNGDGTFKVSTSGRCENANVTVGDLTSDGAIDIIAPDSIGIRYYQANTRDITSIQRFSLLSVDEARESLTNIDKFLQCLSSERGVVGALQSRLSSAVATLTSSRDVTIEARNRIMDADVASEVASLIRNQVLQESAQNVLTHSRLDQELIIKLLSNPESKSLHHA